MITVVRKIGYQNVRISSRIHWPGRITQRLTLYLKSGFYCSCRSGSRKKYLLCKETGKSLRIILTFIDKLISTTHQEIH
jgi:hypothetical protein